MEVLVNRDLVGFDASALEVSLDQIVVSMSMNALHNLALEGPPVRMALGDSPVFAHLEDMG